MAEPVPVTELGVSFSSPNASPTEWSQARDELTGAELYWLSTVVRGHEKVPGYGQISPRSWPNRSPLVAK